MSDKDAPGYVPNPHYSQEDWNAVCDNPEWTDEEIANARPFAEVFPEWAAEIKRGRGPQKAARKVLTSLRLDSETLAAFRATGPGWQKRIDEILKEAAKSLG
jgi:uncharacterized protein (DUF4415 family)